MTNWAEVSASQMIEDDKCATDIEEPEAKSSYYKSYGGIHQGQRPRITTGVLREETWTLKTGQQNRWKIEVLQLQK